MSAAKFECAPYKLPFEPDYHPQRPIIIGEEGLESPETVTLKYEEAAARANGGDLRGDTPPGLLPMSHYGKPQPAPIHGYDSTRSYQDAAYQQYGAQTYSPQQHENAAHINAAQLNQEAFAANSAVGQYIPVGPTVMSCQPSSGVAGTKVLVRLSSQYDLLSMASPVPCFYLFFGTHKAIAEAIKEDQDNVGYMLTISTNAPQFLVTGCDSDNVPLTLLIETPNGEEVSRTAAGQFVYHDAPMGGPGASAAEITRKMSKSPEQHHHSPRSANPQLGHESTTNTYDFAAAPQQPAQSSYGTGYAQDNSNMLSTYRSTSFTEQHYPRAVPPPLRPPMPTWQAYGRSPGPPITHTQITRPSLTPLPMPTATTPSLVRTSTLQSSIGAGQGAAYNPWGPYSPKAILKIVGKLDSMALDWSPDEWANRRRIVLFKKTQTGSTLTTTFRAVNVNERPPNSICISCIWWAEKGECYVTSVDTIYLLEQLVVAPGRFSVEEKNRIRRNLEGFRPQTVSKARAESEEFFKIIMAFPNPKPRNIEKDVKVFPWKILENALKKIIGKYSASPSAVLPPSHLLTPTPPSSYPSLPTPIATVATDPVTAYAIHSQGHHDNLTSPRSIAGSTNSWSAYSTAPPRTLSPAILSPRQSSVRLSLPSVTGYDSRGLTTSSYGTGLHSSLAHQPTPPPAISRWDPTIPSVHTPATYADQYQSLSAHHTPNHQVYGTSTYSDGTSRA